jgi:hypothetical protein
MTNKLTRRVVLRNGLQISVGGAVSIALAGCGGAKDEQFSCVNPDDLSEGERSMRVSLNYKDKSPDAAQACKDCAFFTADTAGGGCGACELLGGQVSDQGRCESWSERD